MSMRRVVNPLKPAGWSLPEGNSQIDGDRAMERSTMKITTVIVSLGEQRLCYRSISDVPDDIRDKINQAISGPNAATILIADEAGRQEIERSFDGAARLFADGQGGAAVLDQFEQEIERDRWNG
jgi:hypothetical protein